MKNTTCIGIILLVLMRTSAQDFYFGADLSYVNEMEACGAVYTEQGVVKDPYAILRDHGTTLVRLRLWHTPSWYDNLNDGHRYSDLADVRQSIQRAKTQGMDVLLDFHLSDNWADPSHQVAPAAWTSVLDNLPILQDSLYNYIYSTLMNLADDNLLPAIVQIGNETNKGILQSQEQNDSGWSLHWPRNSALFNTAIDAIHDVEVATGNTIKIMLHIANPNDVDWMMEQFWDHGVQDFDIIGISYYAWYHPVSITSVGNILYGLTQAYPGKEVMIVETAYPWTVEGDDSAANLLQGVAGYTPSPAVQRQWMIDLVQRVIIKGGSGVVYWEPAWVSTSCSTQWAQGSHWENATYFDFNNNLHEDGVTEWMTYDYIDPVGVKPVAEDNIVAVYSDGESIYVNQLDELHAASALQVQVMSMDGRNVFLKNIMMNGKGSIARVEIMLSSGIYAIRVVSGKNVIAVDKVIVIH